MKNKKTIAIATAAMSLAGTVVPVFANQPENSVQNLPTEVNLRAVNGRRLANASDVHGTQGDKREYLNESEVIALENKSELNPKMVGSVNVDNEKCYIIEIDDSKSTNDSKYQESQKIKAIEDFIKGLKNDYPGRYEIEQKTYEARIDERRDKVIDTKLVVNVIDTQDVTGAKDGVVYTFTFKGIYTDFGFGQELPVEQNTVQIDFNKNNSAIIKWDEDKGKAVSTSTNTPEAHKELDRIIYELKKASDKITVVEEKETKHKTVLKILIGGNELIGRVVINNKGQGFDKNSLKNIPGKNDFVGHWAESLIVEGMLNNIIDVSAKFNPDQAITRAEFAKMACEAYHVSYRSGQDKENYSDVKPGDWYYGYIAALTTRGYINGYTDGTFKPNATITRQEAAKIIAELEANKNSIDTPRFNVETVTVDKDGNKVHHYGVNQTTGERLNVQFDDFEEIHNWADQSVSELVKAKKIGGYKENGKTLFKATGTITKAESLAMMTQALENN